MEEETIVINRSADYAQLAIQGLRSIEVLQKLTPFNLQEIKYYCFAQSELCGVESIISRTGYSGEDGFELYFSPDFAINIWESLMTEGKVCGLQPVGMGARDTLRLEMGFPLYGHELNETTTLLEAGLGRLIDFSKPHFIGKEILLNQKTDGIQRKLVGFQMLGERIPRSKYEIYKNIKKVGIVTSGTMSPTFQRGVGLGYVRVEEAWEGNEISIMIRQKALPAAIVKIPFINRFADISENKGGACHGVTRQAS